MALLDDIVPLPERKHKVFVSGRCTSDAFRLSAIRPAGEDKLSMHVSCLICGSGTDFQWEWKDGAFGYPSDEVIFKTLHP